MKSFKATLLALVASVASTGFAAISPSGDMTGATDYTAISAAVAKGGTVELGEGTFYVNAETVITDAVTVQGAGRDLTIIQLVQTKGKFVRHFTLNNDKALLTHLTLKGGGIDSSTNNDGGKHGGAVLIEANGGKVIDCRLTENQVGMNAAGLAVYMNSDNAIVSRCVIDKNFSKNNYPSGAAVHVLKGTVENCLIVGNSVTGASRADWYVPGGVSVAPGNKSISTWAHGYVYNCTIVGNTGRNLGGAMVDGAIDQKKKALTDAHFYNCIIYGNIVGSAKDDYTTYANCYGQDANFVDCILLDPTFKDVNTGDYRLSKGSAAIGMGKHYEWMGNAVDLAGTPFSSGEVADCGCYQYVEELEDWVDITASPKEYGEVVPPYGRKSGLSLNQEVECVAPDYLGVDGAASATHWEVRDPSGTVVDSGVGNSFVYTHSGVHCQIVWFWEAKFPVSVTAAAGGTVSVSADSAAYGETVEVTAYPDATLSGVSFWKWEGDVPAGHQFDNPLELTVDAAKSLKAIFGTKTAYVASAENPSSSPSFPFGSADTAANSLAEALAVTADGGEIFCGEGTYQLAAELTVDRSVTIRGAGFDKTTLDLNQQHFNLMATGAIVEGFKVTGAMIEWNSTGGGIIVTAGTVSKCRFTGNVDKNGINAKGLCASVIGADGRVTHCIFDNNDTTAKNTIGVFAMTAGLVDNCLFVSNRTQRGTVYVYGGGTIRNCTIAGNEAVKTTDGNSGKGGGLFVGNNWGPVIENCLVYGNAADVSGAEYYLDASFSEVQRNHLSNASCYGEDNGISTADINATPSLDGDYRLKAGSSGIDAGVDYAGMNDDVDLGGDPRVVNDRVDLGCYEYVPSTEFACTIDASAWSGLVGSSITLLAKFDETMFSPADYVFAWTVTGKDASEVVAESVQKPSVTLSNPTEYTISLVVTDKDGKTAFGGTAEQTIKILPATVYLAVSNPNAAFPYDTEGTAATNLVELAKLLVDGCEVVVLEGEHEISEPIEIKKAVTIRSAKGRDFTTVRQIAKSGNIRRLFQLNNAKAVLEGLTLTGGYMYNESGAAVRISTDGGTVRDCRLTGNESSMNSSGAIALDGAKAYVTRTIVDNNVNNNDYGYCAGAYLGAGVMDNCLVYSNRITNCSMRKFQVAGGVQMDGGIMSNCTVTANFGRGVGGICFYDGYNWKGGKAVNCIVYGNAAQEEYLVETSPEYYVNDANKIVNCLFTDPKFVDAANCDFHLQKGSPAVNAGVRGDYTKDSKDLDGNPRVTDFNTRQHTKCLPDLGCYESPWGTPGLTLIVR